MVNNTMVVIVNCKTNCVIVEPEDPDGTGLQS